MSTLTNLLDLSERGIQFQLLLATLILILYIKLLSVTITALSFAILDYPDGYQEIVWLPDGNVKYFQGTHILLALLTLLIILIGLQYTTLLFLWQWIVSAPKYKLFIWTRNIKLNAFITTYHIPHNSKYRYWTGLLLLARGVFYITASITESAHPQTLPLCYWPSYQEDLLNQQK